MLRNKICKDYIILSEGKTTIKIHRDELISIISKADDSGFISLNDFFEKAENIDVNELISYAAKMFMTTENAIRPSSKKHKKRDANSVMARYVCFYILLEKGFGSEMMIAKLFNYDRCTVLYGHQKVCDVISNDRDTYYSLVKKTLKRYLYI